MILALAALGVSLLVLPGLTRSPHHRLLLREWVPITATSLVVGLSAVELALVLVALPTVAHSVGFAAVADACHHVLAPLPYPPAAVGWIAAGFAGVLGVRFLRGMHRAWALGQAARAEPWLGQHEWTPDFELVVLPTQEALAYGAPGTPPQVLVSQGLVDRFSDDTLGAVLAHECAHHRLGHWRYLALLTGIERALGVLRPIRASTSRLRDALEAQADEAATERGAHPEVLRHALVELAGHSHPEVRERCTRLGRRVRPRPTVLRALSYSPVAVLSVAAALVALDWLTAGHHAAALGTTCPS